MSMVLGCWASTGTNKMLFSKAENLFLEMIGVSNYFKEINF